MLYLHKNKVIHRGKKKTTKTLLSSVFSKGSTLDLAARNLLVKMEGNNYVVKVADFGMAKTMDEKVIYSAASEVKFARKWVKPFLSTFLFMTTTRLLPRSSPRVYFHLPLMFLHLGCACGRFLNTAKVLFFTLLE